MTNQLESALALAQQKFSVIPAHGITKSGNCTCGNRNCKSPGKHPAIIGWQKAATTDPEQIRQWWHRNSLYNPAIATGNGLLVLDVDGEAGMASLKKLEEIYGPLPITPTVITGSGYKHVYFSCKRRITNSAGKLGPGLDIRADGGLVIANGAMHKSGNMYHWDEGRSPADVELAEIPDWLLNLVLSRKENQKAKINIDDPIPEHQRNVTLNSYAFSMRKYEGKTMAQITSELHELNRTKCNPPLSDEEVDSIIKSIDKLGRSGGAEDDFALIHPSGLICAADVEDKDMKFLIYPYIPEGDVTIMQGNPGDGKTAFSCYLAARVSTGTDILGIPCEQGNVLILSVEDHLSILKQRIIANGGDLSHCFFVGEACTLSFTSPEIEQYIKQCNAKLVIFDPFQNFVGAKVDMHRANETRPIMSQMAAVAERLYCSIVVVCHMSKRSSDGPAVLRSMGSTDIPASSRSIIQVGRSDDNPDQRLIVHVKANNSIIGKSMLFSIGENAKVTMDGFTSKNDSNFYTFGKKVRDAANDSFLYEQIRNALKKVVKENPQGRYVSYSNLGVVFPQGTQPKRVLMTLRSRLEEEEGITIGDFKRKAEGMSVWVASYVDDFLN